MITAISNLCARFASGWALLAASPDSNLPSNSYTISLTVSHTISLTISHTISLTISLTILTICAKASRARRNLQQVNRMRRTSIPGCGGPVLKSLVPSARKFGFGCSKVWFRVLESLVPGLSPSLCLPFAGQSVPRPTANFGCFFVCRTLDYKQLSSRRSLHDGDFTYIPALAAPYPGAVPGLPSLNRNEFHNGPGTRKPPGPFSFVRV
jgi:hypothetical protein